MVKEGNVYRRKYFRKTAASSAIAAGVYIIVYSLTALRVRAIQGARYLNTRMESQVLFIKRSKELQITSWSFLLVIL